MGIMIMDVIDTNIMNVIACIAIPGCVLLFVLIVIATHWTKHKRRK